MSRRERKGEDTLYKGAKKKKKKEDARAVLESERRWRVFGHIYTHGTFREERAELNSFINQSPGGSTALQGLLYVLLSIFTLFIYIYISKIYIKMRPHTNIC
jgi:hypothetical protein